MANHPVPIESYPFGERFSKKMIVIANVRPFGSNIGNLAINFAMRQMVHDVFGRFVSIIDIPAKLETGDSAAVGLTTESVHQINQVADGVIVGGGNLFENSALSLDQGALAALAPPLMLFGNSWGRIYGRFGELIQRTDSINPSSLLMLLNRADISLSRDSATTRLMNGINTKDVLGWCPTIALNRYRKPIDSVLTDEKVGALISVRAPELMNIPYSHQNRVSDSVAVAIDELKALGFERVRLLCNDKRDLSFASSFRNSHKVDFLYTPDVYEYLSSISRSQMIVSFRLHATVPALSYGVPVVNVSYDERAKILLEDLKVGSEDLNFVEGVKTFDAELRKKIRSGGIQIDKIAEARKHWDSVLDFQLTKMSDFHELVRAYVSNAGT